ncbi:MAG: hypothetical protein O2901_15600, partial [Verrucomicrobia bacterium]|nr:hypothetical protein [Verrucomicrobiota bacterium]
MNSDHSPDAAAATVTPTAEGCEIALFSSILGLSTRFPVSEQFGERAAEPQRGQCFNLLTFRGLVSISDPPA